MGDYDGSTVVCGGGVGEAGVGEGWGWGEVDVWGVEEGEGGEGGGEGVVPGSLEDWAGAHGVIGGSIGCEEGEEGRAEDLAGQGLLARPCSGSQGRAGEG